MLQIETNMNETLIIFCTYNGWPEFNEIQMVKPRRNYVNRIERRSVKCEWNFCNRSIYIWSVSYMHITSNINTLGKRNTLEGRWSGKFQNFNWIMDALIVDYWYIVYILHTCMTLKLVCLHNLEIFQQRTNFKFTIPYVTR
jgi:hypothetical protein